MASTGRRITIPPEMMMEILYRLPVKSIFRFKCVSKVWLSLLSSPQFIKTHHQTLNQKHLIFVADQSLYSVPVNYHENSVLTPTKLQFESKNWYFNIRSCNGLVLASFFDPDDPYEFQRSYKHVVVNPATMEFTELPMGHQMRDSVSKTESTCGFGYDSVSDDYKVVTIFHFHNKYLSDHFEKMYVHVYSLRTNNWTRVFDTPSDHFPYKRGSNGVFINGCIHWFSRKGSKRLVVILAFSLSNEKFSEVCLPDSNIVAKNGDAILIDVGGKLGIFLEAEGEVWLMNEYGVKESWTKISLIGLDEFSVVKLMIFYDNGKLMVADNKRLLTYDIEKRSFCKNVEISLKQEKKETNRDEMIIKSTYVESAASPKLIRTNQASVDLSEGFEELEMVFEVGEKKA